MSHPVYRLIDIAPDLVVNPKHVAAVKDLGRGKCAVFLVGQSAVDGGFLVDRDWNDVVEEVNDELAYAMERGIEIAEGAEDESSPEEDQAK